MKRLTFPKTRRLVTNQQFKAVLDRGRRARDGLLTLYAAPNDLGYPRLGVSVGRAAGNAVVRNRLKRLLREAFRLSQEAIPPGYDYLLMPAPRLWQRRRRTARPRSSPPPLTADKVRESFLALVKIALGVRPPQPDRPDPQDPH